MDAVAVRAVLARAPGLHAGHLHSLVAAADGDLTRVLELNTLNAVDLPRAAHDFLIFPDLSRLESDLKWIHASGTHLLASTDADYPAQLRSLANSPAVLFVLGNPHTLSDPQVAMVGARKASGLGRRT